MRSKRLLAIWLVLSIIVASGACGQGGTPQDAVAEAVSKMTQLQSYRSCGNSTTVADSRISQSSFQFEVAAPDRYRAQGTTDSQWRETVTIGNEKYFRDGQTTEWKACLTGTCGATVTIEQSLGPLRYISDVKRVSENETTTSHWYQGEVDMDAFVDVRASAIGEVSPLLEMREWKIEARLKIDSSGYISELYLETRYPCTDTGTENQASCRMYTHLYFYDFNEPISIARPET